MRTRDHGAWFFWHCAIIRRKWQNMSLCASTSRPSDVLGRTAYSPQAFGSKTRDANCTHANSGFAPIHGIAAISPQKINSGYQYTYRVQACNLGVWLSSRVLLHGSAPPPHLLIGAWSIALIAGNINARGLRDEEIGSSVTRSCEKRQRTYPPAAPRPTTHLSIVSRANARDVLLRHLFSLATAASFSSGVIPSLP